MSRKSLFFLILTMALVCSLPSLALCGPMKEVVQSREFRKALGTQNKRVTVDSVYNKKWLNPGSFFGQLFLRDNGYMQIFEWLNVPTKMFGPVTTTVRKRPEYIEVIRTYLDNDSKSLALSVLIPHPRSKEVAESGLIPVFNKRTPTIGELHKKVDLEVGGKKATAYYWEDNQCSILYQAATSALLEVRVENCKLYDSLLAFFQSLDLKTFDQRLQS